MISKEKFDAVVMLGDLVDDWYQESDSDYSLVTEENLHKIMSEEEIERGLEECSTYDEVPDLIVLPNDIHEVVLWTLS